jgi:hypothetical protein
LLREALPRALQVRDRADEIAALLGIARATFYLVLSRLAPDLRSWQHGIGLTRMPLDGG